MDYSASLGLGSIFEDFSLIASLYKKVKPKILSNMAAPNIQNIIIAHSNLTYHYVYCMKVRGILKEKATIIKGRVTILCQQH